MSDRGRETAAQDAGSRLDAAVATLVDGKKIRSAVLHVDAPALGLRGCWAHGVADLRDGRPMSPQTPFLSASIGKLAMAATAFDLAARGVLALDASIARWIDAAVLAELPVQGAAEAVTVRMLLANRSGLPDYFDSKVHLARDGAPSVFSLMVSEPERRWTRDQLLAYARDHYEPCAAPGERFLYSDLNWDLLGLIFEAIEDRPFHEVVRARVLDPLGLGQTWYHVFEAAPAGLEPYADNFLGDTNLAHRPSQSADQAGGGLVTTAEDLGRLVRGLAEGRPVALSQLATDFSEDAMSQGLDYGYGAWRWRPQRISASLGHLPELVGISGANNTFAYLSAHGDVIAGTLSQLDVPARHVRFVLSKVLPLLAR